MNKKAHKAFFLILAIIFFIIICGVSFGIAGKFFLTTKYYDTPKEAFDSEYVPSSIEKPIDIGNQIDIIRVDKNNCLFLALTKDDELLIASMIMKNNKFSFSGESYVYDYKSEGDYKTNYGFIKNKTYLYNTNGKIFDSLEWSIIFNDEAPFQNYEYKEYELDNYKDFKIIFFNNLLIS